MSPSLQETLAALHAGQASLADVREVLRESHVLVPKPAGAASGGRSLSLPVMEFEGGTAVPLFSAPETFAAAAREGAAYVGIPFEGLLPGWPDGIDAVFDPGQPWALRVPGHAMKEPAAIQAPAGSQVVVGDPAVEPAALLEQLARQLRRLPEVQAAWRAQILLEGPGETPHLAIGLAVDDGGDEEAALERVGEFAGAAVDGPLDLLIVEPGSGDPIAEYMLAHEPFYRRDAG